nr:DUF924 family protein [Stenotrophomonas maltophilia]
MRPSLSVLAVFSPHRNWLLGRRTTDAEQDFLDQAGFAG